MTVVPVTSPSPSRVAALTGAVLLAVYAATLAPGLTLWDSGEFLAAVRTLGVPHPPGTPLFIFVANAWARVLVPLPLAPAVNLGSAVATAGACAVLAGLIRAWTGRALPGVAGGVAAGTMASVWLSATETEVYAYSLLLAACTLAAAHRAATRPRHRLLVAFLFGLAVPLHISALVVGPAAVALLAMGADGRLSVHAALAPAGCWLAAVGMGTVSAAPLAIAVVLLAAAAVLPRAGDGARPAAGVLTAGLLVVLGASFAVVMLVRALHDPGVNQGNPSTWGAFVEVIARSQYDVPPLWPRRAPAWLQVGNLVQYADWQVALGQDDWPGASWRRTPWTLAFVALGWVGARWHAGRDRRSFLAVALLLVAASLGVVAVLNLRSGPSFGFGVLPPGALHEARERDYFFSLAFATWGLWAGAGIVHLAARVRSLPARIVMGAACLAPMLLNWKAADRSGRPDRDLPALLGRSLLASAPPGAVLLAAGDNDSFALWFAQHVMGLRRDVTTITIPLLGADWYRAELRRRHGLLDEDHVVAWLGSEATLANLGAVARRNGRAIAVAVSVALDDRAQVGGDWILDGMAYRDRRPADRTGPPAVDVASTRRVTALVDSVLAGAGPARDATGRYVERLLGCPALALAMAGAAGRAGAPSPSDARREAAAWCALRDP